MHGVDLEIETPELVTSSLERLDSHIEAVKHVSKADAYLMAECLSPSFVQNEKFRLIFLRSVRFDIEQTAIRLFAHFESKLQLFGADKLCRKISIDDMSEDDMITLKNGQTQLLPDRDRSGMSTEKDSH